MGSTVFPYGVHTWFRFPICHGLDNGVVHSGLFPEDSQKVQKVGSCWSLSPDVPARITVGHQRWYSHDSSDGSVRCGHRAGDLDVV